MRPWHHAASAGKAFRLLALAVAGSLVACEGDGSPSPTIATPTPLPTPTITLISASPAPGSPVSVGAATAARTCAYPRTTDRARVCFTNYLGQELRPPDLPLSYTFAEP